MKNLIELYLIYQLQLILLILEKWNLDVMIKKDSNQLEKITGVRDKDTYGLYCEDLTNTFICVKFK